MTSHDLFKYSSVKIPSHDFFKYSSVKILLSENLFLGYFSFYLVIFNHKHNFQWFSIDHNKNPWLSWFSMTPSNPVTAKETDILTTTFREANEIECQRPTLNQDSGYELPAIFLDM